MGAITDRLFGPLGEYTTPLLATSAIGVYLLVVVGATTSLLDAGTACSTWPTCNGGLFPGGDNMAVLAWGHRVVGLVVGLLLIVTVGTAWTAASRRVRTVITLAAALYPVQTILGASIAIYGASRTLTLLHLTVAVSIFTGILVGLLWQLESETVAPPESAERRPSDGGTGATVEPAAAPTTTRAGKEEPSSMAVQPGGSTAEPPRYSVREKIGAYVSLTKPKLWWLLALVAVASMALAAGPSLSPWNVIATVSGGVLAIGASGTFNNLLERDRDRYMERTADRPLLNGTITPRGATVFGVLLTLASLGVFLAFVNALAAALGFLAILYYSVVYTLLLKPHTDQNIVIGGAVGAFPALIGWAAVTNTIGLPAVVLGAIVFLWTPAHFYNLALAYKEDYARADFPMLPITRTDATARRHILLYLGGTMAAAVTLGAMGPLDWLYATASLLVGGVFLWAVVGLFRDRTDRAAFRTFHASNAYLGVLLVAIVFDALLA